MDISLLWIRHCKLQYTPPEIADFNTYNRAVMSDESERSTKLKPRLQTFPVTIARTFGSNNKGIPFCHCSLQGNLVFIAAFPS